MKAIILIFFCSTSDNMEGFICIIDVNSVKQFQLKLKELTWTAVDFE